MSDQFPCPACGFLTFEESPGSYSICRICGWEDDHVQLAYPSMRGGANGESLCEAQIAALEEYPLSVQEVSGAKRDPQWRPLTNEEAAIRADVPFGGYAYFMAATIEPPGYYWRELSDQPQSDAART